MTIKTAIRDRIAELDRQLDRHDLLDDLENLDTSDCLVRVALTYRTAFALGEAPTKAVAVEHGMTRDVAAKLVQRARARGLLGPTDKGRKSA